MSTQNYFMVQPGLVGRSKDELEAGCHTPFKKMWENFKNDTVPAEHQKLVGEWLHDIRRESRHLAKYLTPEVLRLCGLEANESNDFGRRNILIHARINGTGLGYAQYGNQEKLDISHDHTLQCSHNFDLTEQHRFKRTIFFESFEVMDAKSTSNSIESDTIVLPEAIPTYIQAVSELIPTNESDHVAITATSTGLIFESGFTYVFKEAGFSGYYCVYDHSGLRAQETESITEVLGPADFDLDTCPLSLVKDDDLIKLVDGQYSGGWTSLVMLAIAQQLRRLQAFHWFLRNLSKQHWDLIDTSNYLQLVKSTDGLCPARLNNGSESDHATIATFKELLAQKRSGDSN